MRGRLSLVPGEPPLAALARQDAGWGADPGVVPERRVRL
jgi:hypothetical protein